MLVPIIMADDASGLFRQYETDYCNKSTDISRAIRDLASISGGAHRRVVRRRVTAQAGTDGPGSRGQGCLPMHTNEQGRVLSAGSPTADEAGTRPVRHRRPQNFAGKS